MTSYQLGPLPWSEETLAKVYWNPGFSAAYEAIREHPGFDLNERLKSLKATLGLFEKWGRRFQEDLARFNIEAHENGLMEPRRKSDLEGFERDFQEALYIYSNLAKSLVDQCHGMKKYEVPGYEEKKSAFPDDPVHRLIVELRNDVAHVVLFEPNWLLSSGRDGRRTSDMLIFPHQFRNTRKWNSLAREYLAQQTQGIQLAAIITQYSQKVAEFHRWFTIAISDFLGHQIADYLRCERYLHALGARAWWRLMLSQVVIQNKKDPFQYLDRYLNPAQRTEIDNLPHRSKAQVDRIIAMVDEFGCCDEELRTLAYRAFEVGHPNQIEQATT